MAAFAPRHWDQSRFGFYVVGGVGGYCGSHTWIRPAGTGMRESGVPPEERIWRWDYSLTYFEIVPFKIRPIFLAHRTSDLRIPEGSSRAGRFLFVQVGFRQCHQFETIRIPKYANSVEKNSRTALRWRIIYVESKIIRDWRSCNL